MKMQQELFHATAFLHHTYICWYGVTYIDTSNVTDEYTKLAFGALGWRFFSGWTFAIQLLFLTLAVLEDSLQVIPTVDMTKLRLKIEKFNNYFFLTFVIPMSLVTSFVFWTLYSVDRELVFPSAFDPLVGRWLNHSVHSVIVLVVAMELFLKKHYHTNTLVAMRDLAIYLAIYDLLFLYTYFIEGIWVYPVYAALGNWFNRILFMAYGHISVIGFYFLGKFLNKAIWGNHNTEQCVSGQQSLKMKNS